MLEGSRNEAAFRTTRLMLTLLDCEPCLVKELGKGGQTGRTLNWANIFKQTRHLKLCEGHYAEQSHQPFYTSGAHRRDRQAGARNSLSPQNTNCLVNFALHRQEFSQLKLLTVCEKSSSFTFRMRWCVDVSLEIQAGIFRDAVYSAKWRNQLAASAQIPEILDPERED